MTDSNKTELICVIDRSGSMANVVDDTIGGFNSLIQEQKKTDEELGTETNVTTVLFDHEYELLHDGVDIQKIETITTDEYFPRGSTALLDAIGRSVNTVGHRLSKLNEKQRPGKVAVFVITDGGENASDEFSGSQIKDIIKTQEDEYSWIFNFMGANQDAFLTAGNLGFDSRSIANYSSTKGIAGAVFSASSSRLTSMKSAGNTYNRSVFLSDVDDLQVTVDSAVDDLNEK